jgi:chemotaxis protein CheD
MGNVELQVSTPMNMVTVDISDYKVSSDPQAVLVTYALGSCIAVLVHDPVRVVGGMIHYMLPLSKINPEKARLLPGMFADTGIPQLFQSMYQKGCKKEDLVVKVVGGAQLHDASGVFNIGKRNYTVLRKMFWKQEVIIAAEDIGGSKSRTARLFVGSGRCTVCSQGEELEL